jgi:mono/diheme cytochrome c family protein
LNNKTGKGVYTAKCMACHGADLGGVKGTGAAALIGGRGSLLPLCKNGRFEEAA